MAKRSKLPGPPPEPIVWPRADPKELAAFDPSSKLCVMNCAQHKSDPRSYEEHKLLCNDCQIRTPDPGMAKPLTPTEWLSATHYQSSLNQLSELAEAHSKLDIEGVPRELDGKRLSLSGRLACLLDPTLWPVLDRKPCSESESEFPSSNLICTPMEWANFYEQGRHACATGGLHNPPPPGDKGRDPWIVGWNSVRTRQTPVTRF